LAGLIDADGHVGNYVCIPTIYPRIRDGLIQLARSLGIPSTTHTKSAYVSQDGVNHKESYFVDLLLCSNLTKVLTLCAVPRKRNGYLGDDPKKKKKNGDENIQRLLKEHNLFKFEVSKHGIGEYYGFQLSDEADHLFQLSNGTVVHNCISTGDGVGMIEVVLNSDTIAHITSEYGGAQAVYSKEPLITWLKKQNPEKKNIEQAQLNFTYSSVLNTVTKPSSFREIDLS